MASSSRSMHSSAAGGSLRDLITSIVSETNRSRRQRGQQEPTVFIDVPPGHNVPAIALRRALEPLVRRALESACRSAVDTDGPPLRELCVTSVDVGDAIEIEVADSGPALPEPVRSWLAGRGDVLPEGAGLALAAVRAEAARLGAALRVHNCAEGGVAITLRLPHRQAGRLAA